MALRRLAILLLISMAAGCGGGKPELTDEAARKYIDERFHDQLVTSILIDRSPAARLPEIHVPDYSRMFPDPPDRSPVGRYIEWMEREAARAEARRRFHHRPPRIKVEGTIEDCNVPAKLVDFQITKRTEENGIHKLEFLATQELQVDLYKSTSEYKYTKTIGWDRERFQVSVRQANQLPRAEALEKQWFEAMASRQDVQELVYKRGSRWMLKGTIRAEFGGLHWMFRCSSVELAEKPDLFALTADRFPEGMFIADPKSPNALADFNKPFEDFMLAVDARMLVLQSQAQKQPDLLARYLQPGMVWQTEYVGDQGKLHAQLTITKRDEKSIHGEFVATVNNRPLKMPIYGSLVDLGRSRARVANLNPDLIPFELYGKAIHAFVSSTFAKQLPSPWNKLEFVIAANVDEDAPSLVWLDRAQKMKPGP